MVHVVVVLHSHPTISASGILVLVDHALSVGIFVVREYIFQVFVSFLIVIDGIEVGCSRPRSELSVVMYLGPLSDRALRHCRIEKCDVGNISQYLVLVQSWVGISSTVVALLR